MKGTLVHVGYTWAENLARIATTPEISGLLLSLGVLGLLIEMQTLHGIAGTLGILALALFFGTHIYAGFSNSLVVGLAVLGVIAILLELHVVPGHGFAGIFGMIALVAAVILAFGIAFFAQALQAIAIAIVFSAVAFWGATRIFPESAFFKRITLSAVQGPSMLPAETSVRSWTDGRCDVVLAPGRGCDDRWEAPGCLDRRRFRFGRFTRPRHARRGRAHLRRALKRVRKWITPWVSS